VAADNDQQLIPVVGLTYKRFFFQTIALGYHLVQRQGFELDALFGIRFLGYEEDDSPFLEGMEDRDPPIDAGLEAKWQGRHLGVSLGLSSDALGDSHGQIAALELFAPLSFGRLRFEPKIGAEWMSANSVDYLFGVRPEEARPGRPAYEADSTVNLVADAELLYPFRRHLVLRAFLRYRFLGSQITDSPIVDDSSALTGLVALTYRSLPRSLSAPSPMQVSLPGVSAGEDRGPGSPAAPVRRGPRA
jgi:outer membrane protein